MQLAADDLLLGGVDLILHILRHHIAEGCQIHNPVRDVAPVSASLPLIVVGFLDGILVVDAPVPDRRGQHGVRRDFLGDSVIADGICTILLGQLIRLSGVALAGDHVGAGIEQRLCRLTLGGRIEPVHNPDRVQFHFWIDGAGAQSEGVQVAHHLWDGVGRDVAQHVRLGHPPGSDPGQVPALVASPVVDTDVLRRLIAGAVLEQDIGILLGHRHYRVHIAEGGGEDHVVALFGVIADDALRVWSFRDILAVGRLDVIQIIVEFLAPLVVGVAPAQIAHRTDINEGHLQVLLGRLSARPAALHCQQAQGD